MRYMMLVQSFAPAGPRLRLSLRRWANSVIAGGQLGGADASARVRLAARKNWRHRRPIPGSQGSDWWLRDSRVRR
jgi:hypothetical protein